MRVEAWIKAGLCAAFLTAATARAEPVGTETFYSPVLERDWKYRVFTPRGYSEESNRRYPVVFLLHGSGGDETGWDHVYPCLRSLIHEQVITPTIAIAPASGSSWWVDGIEPFETAFFADLIPEVQRNYRVLDSRNAWIIAGFSMGGYGALRYSLVGSRRFAAAVLLSPALYYDFPPEGSSARSSGAFGNPFDPALWRRRNYPALLPAYIDRGLTVRTFIAAGDEEWNHPGHPALNVEAQAVRLYGILNRNLGHPADLRIIDGGHDWSLWLPLFRDAMETVARGLTPFQPADGDLSPGDAGRLQPRGVGCTTR